MNLDYLLLTLGILSFIGGLIDATVGGGGLIQLPALLHSLPQHSLPAVFGTNKLAVLAGTTFSFLSYKRKIKTVWRLILPTMITAFLFSYAGAMSVTYIQKNLMEYVVFFLLIAVAIYTFFKKDLGANHTFIECSKKKVLSGMTLGGLIGFYDGIFGPGSGSFLLFLFVRYFGFDFINASASAKLVNLGTFSGALVFFIPSGNVLWAIGGLVAGCNIAGSLVGTHLALRYGSKFIRIFFLILLIFLISRMGVSLFL